MADYPQLEIDTEFGTITVELWNDVAPKHTENFLRLADDGFYDGLTFHRIIPGFVIQGGCPRGDGTGGPEWSVDAEFNDRKHTKGVLSMARSSDPNSAGSQFFICLSRDGCKHLDGQYTAFGEVVEGIEVVDQIAATQSSHQEEGLSDEAPKMNTVRRVGAQT